MREAEINRIKNILEKKDNECILLSTELKIARNRLREIEEEMEMKSGENNRLRKQCCNLEEAMKDLYKSRKGPGTMQIEIESLKSDNERLLSLLKSTTEYADMEDNEILKSAATKTMKGATGIAENF